MPATSNFVLAKGKNTSTALTKKRFVKLDTAATDGETVKACDTAGEGAFGVSLFSVSAAEITKDKGASVQVEGIAVVEAAAALAVGVLVTTDNVGRAAVAASGNYILGKVVEPAGAPGNEAAVLLSVASAAKA